MRRIPLRNNVSIWTPYYGDFIKEKNTQNECIKGENIEKIEKSQILTTLYI